MHILFDFVAQVIFVRLGALIKMLFGRPRSESGISEMWIGILLVIAVVVIVMAASR